MKSRLARVFARKSESKKHTANSETGHVSLSSRDPSYPLHDDEIRMLNVHTGSGDESLICTLETTSRVDSRPYNALSYVWGDQTEQKPLLINDSEAYIGRSLYDALINLRRRDTSLRIWVDAVCINQNDLEERSRQVQRMGDVYAAAKEVFIWLGKARGLSRTLEDVREWMAHATLPRPGDKLAARLTPDQRRSKMPALWDLLSRPWFGRLWVLQEAVLARKAPLILGDERCDLNILDRTDMGNIRTALNESQDASLPTDGKTITSNAVNVITLFQMRACVQNRNDTNEGFLVYACMTRACSDPRDRVFGAVGIAQRLGLEAQKVDYTMSTSDVFYQLMKRALKNTPDWLVDYALLDSREAPQDLPSWVPDLTSTARRVEFSENVHKAGTSFDGSLSDKSFSDAEKRLILSGITFDVVQAECCPAIELVYPDGVNADTLLPVFREYGLDAEKFWADHLSDNSPYGDCNGLLQAVWQTITCNEYGGQPEGEWSYDDREVAKSKGQVYEYIVGRAPIPNHVPGFQANAKGTRRDAVTSFMWSMNEMLPGRALLRTDHGFIGVGPAGLAKGDVVVVICGIRMSLILRKQSHQEEQVWKFIGPAYVHGIMKGEAIQGKRRWDLEQFTIG